VAGSVIPLVAPTITEQDREELVLSIRQGLLEGGEIEVRAFEEEFAAYVGCAGGVAVNSGTNALIVALRALDCRHVNLPTYTCRAILDATTALDMGEDLVDNECNVREAMFHVQPLIRETRDGTVLTHMFGTTARAGVWPYPLIEDFTLSLGAVGSPHFGVCSFHRDKMISTGRGGIIVAQDTEFLERCRELAYYDQPRNGTYSPAFSFGMTGMQAALGRSQLRQLPGFIERRKEIASRYTDAFTAAGIECPNQHVDSVFFRYIIGVTDPAAKVEELAKRGIEAGRGVNPPLHRLLGLPNGRFPGAEECFSKLLSVPVHPGLTDEQVGYIAEQVVEVCGDRG
jgi:perosamine synthetase